MFRLIRPLRIIGEKCFVQNLRISSPMSQSHVYDIFKEQEKKESETESKKVSKIEETTASVTNYDTKIFDEFLERTGNFTEGNTRFGDLSFENSAATTEQDLYTQSPEKLIQFLKHLASKKQRPVNLIKAAVNKLMFFKDGISLLQCSSLLYSFSKLSYRDNAVLDKISETIINKKSEFKEGTLPVSILHSFGMLKYRNCEVIDVLLQCVLKFKDVRTPEEKLTVLMTLATVNYMSPLGTALIQEMLEFSENDFNSTKSYLNFVWACMIVNHLSEKHVSAVLSDDFVNRVLISAGSLSYEICTLKLLNINAAAQTLMKGYSKPLLSAKVSSSKTLHQSKFKMEFTRIVVDGLCRLYPKNKDIKVNIDTGAGFILDVEFSNNNDFKKSKNLPDEKVGIILLGYNDMCCDEAKTIDGFNTFKQRILEAKNYKILNIPFSEYNGDMKMSEKIEYLEAKLKNFDI